jgi:hypothetical protein
VVAALLGGCGRLALLEHALDASRNRDDVRHIVSREGASGRKVNLRLRRLGNTLSITSAWT